MRFYWPIAKTDAERRMVWGYASTEAEDKEGETVKRDALAAALDDYMRFANIREMHQPSAVGVAEEAAIDDKGLYLAARIVDAAAWAKVAAGVYKGFSIGGRVTARDPGNRKIITGLDLTEISVVDRPANPEAVFDCWKRADDQPREPAGLEGRPQRSSPASAHDEYADPGYQPDGEKRYPIDTEDHIRAAWAYIHVPDNAAHYTAGQLAAIEARIVAAWRGHIDLDGPPAAAGKSAVPEPEPTARRRPAGSRASGSRPEAGDPVSRLRAIVADLCDLLEAFGAGDREFAAMAPRPARDALEKREPSPADALAKLAGELLPRLDALSQRVEAIAQTPLPPQTVVRGFASVSKRDDAGGPPAAPDDIVAGLARMSEEERTLTLIKAAHANPITPLGRPLR